MPETRTLTGTTKKAEMPKSASLKASFRAISLRGRSSRIMQTTENKRQLMGISTLKAVRPKMVSRYFSR